MNPSFHAKIELREMRLRRMPKVVANTMRWVVGNAGWLKILGVVVCFVVVSGWQYQSEIDDMKLANAELKKKITIMKAFNSLPRVTFVIEANNFDGAREKFQNIEIAAATKQAEMMAAREEK